MSEKETHDVKDAEARSQVYSGLEEAKEFAKTLNFEDARSGAWFVSLLQKVVRAYDRNARAQYFQQKYPGLPPDEIADILTSVTVRYAAIAGGIAGVSATANQLTTVASAGMTTPLFFGTIGSEMIYLSYIQMRLVLDLSVVYDLQLDPDDPEDVLMVFGYALGVAPTELIGAGARKAAGAGTATVIKKYISKDVLKAIQNFARKLGFKILQRTILKYAVPVASAAVGSSYNYTITRSLGKIAKTHLKNRGRVTEELRTLVSRQNTYDLVFPAAVMYTAQVDGEISLEEKALYRAMLSRMSFDEHTQAEFQKLLSNETHLLEAAFQIENEDGRRSLVDLLVLVAVCDGELASEEHEFLGKVAERLNVPVDLAAVEKRSQDYQAVAERKTFDNLTESASEAAGRARNVVGQTAESARDATIAAGDRLRGTLGNFLKRNQTANPEETPGTESPTITCSSCGTEMQVQYRFCPNCGLSVSEQTT